MSVWQTPLEIAKGLFRQAVLALSEKDQGRGGRSGRGGGARTIKSNDKTERLMAAAWVGGKTTVDALAERPGIQASLDAVKMRLTTGKPEKHETIEAVNRNAAEIIALLESQGVNVTRLAVDGVPGSGKSTLARALAAKLDFELQTLDYIDLNKAQDFDQENTIYEHHRLLRTQDLENFDAIIYIDEPVEISKQKCLNRKRGGINIDVFDYEKLKRIGEKAFEIAEGKVHLIPGSYVKIKLRPDEGFRAYENVKAEVAKKGRKTSGRSKEELLFVSVYGRSRRGLKAYVKLGAYNQELMEGLSAGVLRFLMA